MADARRCLGSSLSWFVLERHLTDGQRPPDLIVLVEGDAGRAALRAHAAAPPSIRRLAEAWVTPNSPLFPLVTFTFEFDAGSSGAPVVFAALQPAVGVRPPPEFLDAALPHFLALAETEVAASLSPILAAMPERSYAVHVGSLRPRGAPGVRLVASVFRPRIGEFLTGAGWPGDIPRALELAGALGANAGWMNVHLDAGADVGPRLGLEVFYPGGPGRDARWDPALQFLEREAAPQADALRGLGGWYRSTGRTLRMIGVKLVIEPDGTLRGKAYLGCRAIPSR